jgi:hypothetical protein
MQPVPRPATVRAWRSRLTWKYSLRHTENLMEVTITCDIAHFLLRSSAASFK